MKVLILNTKQPFIERFWGASAVVDLVRNTLEKSGLEVVLGYAEEEEQARILIEYTRPDIVFPNGYWFLGDRHAPSENTPYINHVLDQIGIPYVGSSAQVVSECLPKKSFKLKLVDNGLPTPRFVSIERPEDRRYLNTLDFPVMTKLNFGAESIGVNKVDDKYALENIIHELYETYHQTIIVEEWCRVKEYTVAVIGNDLERRIMPLEIILPEGYSYLKHELKNSRIKETVCTLCDENKKESIAALISQVCSDLDIRDWARFDVLEDKKGNLFVVDLNLLPGLRALGVHLSYFPICAKLNLSLEYDETVSMLLYTAMKRNCLSPPEPMMKLLNLEEPSSNPFKLG